jgi:hypothetical protein
VLLSCNGTLPQVVAELDTGLAHYEEQQSAEYRRDN